MGEELSAAALGPVTRVFDKETMTFYSGSPLNRLSFLRESNDFLNRALHHESSRFICLSNYSPLLKKLQDGKSFQFKFFTYAQVRDLAGDPFTRSEAETVDAWNSQSDAVGIGRAALVFLGIDHPADSESVLFDAMNDGKYKGVAYFAIDVSPDKASSASLKSKMTEFLENAEKDDKDLVIHNMRFGPRGLPDSQQAIFAQARMYIDWNLRNKFCGGCGSRTMSINGGCKLICPPKDGGLEKGPCETRGVISNLQFPRTDCSIIVAVVSKNGESILLGRNKRFPDGVYSCLAGFLEPAESMEECVRREVWEEAGVKVGRVHIHSSQPWPFPANIMVGCIAEAIDESIHLEHDPELADAQWFPIPVVTEALKRAQSPDYSFGARNGDDPSIILPPPSAIAHTLLNAVCIQELLKQKSSL